MLFKYLYLEQSVASKVCADRGKVHCLKMKAIKRVLLSAVKDYVCVFLFYGNLNLDIIIAVNNFSQSL